MKKKPKEIFKTCQFLLKNVCLFIQLIPKLVSNITFFVTNAHPKLNISITKHSKHSKRSNHSNHNIQIIRSTLQLKPTNSLTDSLTVV